MPDSDSVIPNDPFGPIKQPAAATKYLTSVEVNRLHAKSDVDASPVAQHHTLGIKHNQAATGDHVHDGVGSRRLMEDITISGSKGGNLALADLITKLADALGFTDATT